MLTEKEVEKLGTFDAGGHRVLSVYLNLGPERQVQRTYRVLFGDLVKQIEMGLDDAERKALQLEAGRVQEYLIAEPPQGKGLVLFSCTPRNLWQVYHTPVPVADEVHYDSRPYARPLIDLIDEFERYAVVLVDKEKARLFTVYLDQIEEQQEVFDPVPGKHEQGGWSQARYQRHHEEHVQAHMKHVVERIVAYAEQRPFDRLVLAGPDEAASEIHHLLPETLRVRIVGTFPAEMFISDAEVLERTREVRRQAERAAEERLVDDLIDHAGPGDRATVGVTPTLEALWKGQVRRLVIADSTRLPGGECPQCGLLTVDTATACPACGAPVKPLEDLPERAIEKVLEQAGSVEIVHGHAAERLSAVGRGWGALLRFTTEAETAA